MDELIERVLKAPPLQRWGGLAGALVLITVLNYFLLISPELTKLEQQAAQQRQLDSQLQEKSEIAQNLNERRREMDVLQQKLDEALSELPESADLDELLAQLNEIGRKSGLEISTVEPTPEETAQIYVKIPIKMVLTGNYHEVAMFLQSLANLRRIVNVNNIQLGSPTLKAEKVVLNTSFVATTFRFLDPKAQADAEKKKARQ
ncbi:MAG TPA: type 4a pilus biogenesis protein PilO [Myxococcaceae bacterium]|jgi:type IV pilus assembly protein PilO|nr:type 4a pilus biogenesis protein PilO [Myxococcaceae bacterium]